MKSNFFSQTKGWRERGATTIRPVAWRILAERKTDSIADRRGGLSEEKSFLKGRKGDREQPWESITVEKRKSR